MITERTAKCTFQVTTVIALHLCYPLHSDLYWIRYFSYQDSTKWQKIQYKSTRGNNFPTALSIVTFLFSLKKRHENYISVSFFFLLKSRSSKQNKVPKAHWPLELETAQTTAFCAPNQTAGGCVLSFCTIITAACFFSPSVYVIQSRGMKYCILKKRFT